MTRTSFAAKAAAIAFLCATTSLSASAQRAAELGPNYLRHSAISPDGKTVLFSFRGDIYKVPTTGGNAVPMTVNAAWEGHPVWSHDGKSIALASDRTGNLDIYVMPAEGGEAKRLTFHSADDIPSDFSADGKQVLFSSGRTKSAATVQYPTARMPELYQVSVTGGTPVQLSTNGAMDAVWNADGDKILYREEKAYEAANRKHDRSAFARDIWLYDTKADTHTQMTTDPAGDHTPVWDGKGGFYFLSDRSGTFNVWHRDAKGTDKRLTNHGPHAARSLTASREKQPTLAYLYLGDLYTMQGDRRPKAVDINFTTDSHGRDVEPMSAAEDIAEFAVSPNGKEIAFVSRGDVFVTATDYGTTRRITSTPEAERHVAFTPDGNGLLYAGERDGEWRIYESKRADDSEKYFFAATKLDEQLLFKSDEDVFQPKASPDGKKIAFIAGRDALKVYERDGGKITTVLADEYNYSYADGDITFDWSPDSKWLTIDFAPNGRLFFTNIAVVSADGSGEPHDVSLSGYTDTAPRWHSSGGIVTWATARYGRRDHGSHGSQFDIHAAFLNKDAWDEFNLSKEELALKKEADEEAKKAKDKEKKDDEKKDEADKAHEPIKIEWDRIEDRQKRLTIHSSDLAGATLSKDADKLYYLSAFEAGFDLWVHDFREDETKKLVPLGADRVSMQMSDDGKALFVLADGRLQKVDLEKAAPKGVKVSAMMTVNADEERDYMFRHIWRQVDDKFYLPDFHGVDWAAMKLDYARKVASTNNNRDFADLMDEMLGELNASHTGGRYRANLGGDQTASLGLLFEPTHKGPGLKVAEVLVKGPVADADKTVAQGTVLKAINGQAITNESNYYALLNGKAGERTRLTFTSRTGEDFDIVVKPASLRDEGGWMYDRWVEGRRAAVDKLSGGRLAYVHVPNMSDRSYRAVYREMFGRGMSKEAIVVDTRFNGGGDLTDDLVQLLGGKQYMTNMPYGREAQGEPLTRWTKPSIVLMNEGNYSDGHCFPAGYTSLEMGKTVGMPVPGTCSYVWWERLMSGDLVFGIPQLGIKDRFGDYMENKQLEPTIKIKNDPDSLDDGRDPQLEKAVEVMLKDLDAKQE
jgi:tricorn protease